MKKIILMITIALSFGLATQAQKFTPYVNAGVGISTNVLHYSAQLGESTNKTRYAASVTSVTKSGGNLWKLGGIGYWKLNKSDVASVFATGKAEMNFNRYHALTLTPGLATVFNVGGLFKPEVSIGFPIRENSILDRRPLGVEAGVSLNYSF